MKNTLFVISAIIILSSCSIQKKPVNENSLEDKKEANFIYFYSEANKNRLLGNNDLAIEQYYSALNNNPESASSNFYLATIFFTQKDYQSAKTFAQKAYKLNDKIFWYALAYADILYAKGEQAKSIEIYNEILSKNLKVELLYDRLEEIYKKNKQTKDLIKLLSKKQENLFFSADNELTIYNLYMNSGDVIKAEKSLKKLIINDYENTKYKALLAEYYLSTNQIEKASDSYSNLLKLYPNDIYVRLSYAFYCKHFKKQKEYFEQVKFLIKSNIEFNTKIELLISGQYPNFPEEEYIILLEFLHQKHPNEILSNTLLAESFISNEQQAKAIVYIRKAIELSSSDINLIYTLLELSYDLKLYDDLYKDSKEYLSVFPNLPKIYFYNGIASYYLGNYKNAIDIFDLGKELIIEDIELSAHFYFYIAESNFKLNNFEKSFENFEKAISIKENFYLAMNNYALNLIIRKVNLSKALELSKKCYLAKKSNPIFNYTYAHALFLNSNYNLAYSISEKIVIQYNGNMKFLELHGDILFFLNKKIEAKTYWKLSKQNGNSSEKLKFKIKNIDSLTIKDF